MLPVHIKFQENETMSNSLRPWTRCPTEKAMEKGPAPTKEKGSQSQLPHADKMPASFPPPPHWSGNLVEGGKQTWDPSCLQKYTGFRYWCSQEFQILIQMPNYIFRQDREILIPVYYVHKCTPTPYHQTYRIQQRHSWSHQKPLPQNSFRPELWQVVCPSPQKYLGSSSGAASTEPWEPTWKILHSANRKSPPPLFQDSPQQPTSQTIKRETNIDFLLQGQPPPSNLDVPELLYKGCRLDIGEAAMAQLNTVKWRNV